MKKLFLGAGLFLTVRSLAQDTSGVKTKEWLGVLTLTEKYQDEKNWTQSEQVIVGQHFQRLVKMKSEGIVVLAGKTDLPMNSPDMMGLVIFYAKDKTVALQFMQDDPAVKNNIMKAKVLPYGIAINKCD